MKVNSVFKSFRAHSNLPVAFDQVNCVQAGKRALYTVAPRMATRPRRAASKPEDDFKGWW